MMRADMRCGRCLCGSVTYSIEGEPVIVAHCHCADCQRLSGSGHTTGAMFRGDQVEVRGAVSEYALNSESGSIVTRSFCAKCGSPLFGRNTRMPAYVTVSVGTFDDPNSVSPQVVIFSRSRRHWDLV